MPTNLSEQECANLGKVWAIRNHNPFDDPSVVYADMCAANDVQQNDDSKHIFCAAFNKQIRRQLDLIAPFDECSYPVLTIESPFGTLCCTFNGEYMVINESQNSKLMINRVRYHTRIDLEWLNGTLGYLTSDYNGKRVPNRYSAMIFDRWDNTRVLSAAFLKFTDYVESTLIAELATHDDLVKQGHIVAAQKQANQNWYAMQDLRTKLEALQSAQSTLYETLATLEGESENEATN